MTTIKKQSSLPGVTAVGSCIRQRKASSRPAIAALGDIEKHRLVQSWDQCLACLDRLDHTVSDLQAWKDLVQAEAALEALVLETKGNKSSQVKDLSDSIQDIVDKLANAASLFTDQELVNECFIFISRSLFIAGQDQDAFIFLQSIEYDKADLVQPTLSFRQIMLYAQMKAIQGMIIENGIRIESTENALHSYNECAEIFLSKLTHTALEEIKDSSILKDIEFGILRAIHLQINNPSLYASGVHLCRKILRTTVTSNLRESVVEIFSRALIRFPHGVFLAHNSLKQHSQQHHQQQQQPTHSRNKSNISELSLFVPKNSFEEAILVASINIVEFFSTSVSVEHQRRLFDEIVIVMAAQKQFESLIPILESGISSTLGDSILWLQLAYALISLHNDPQRQYETVLLCIEQQQQEQQHLLHQQHSNSQGHNATSTLSNNEVSNTNLSTASTISNNNTPIMETKTVTTTTTTTTATTTTTNNSFDIINTLQLLASEIAFDYLNDIEKALTHCEIVLASSTTTTTQRCRALLVSGLCHLTMCENAQSPTTISQHQQQAKNSFEKAHELEPDNAFILYHLSLLHAQSRNIPLALIFVKKSLELNPNDADCLHLLVLLLTCDDRFQDGLIVCCQSLLNNRGNFGLMLTAAKLAAKIGGQQSLPIYKSLLEDVITLNSSSSSLIRKQQKSEIDIRTMTNHINVDVTSMLSSAKSAVTSLLTLNHESLSSPDTYKCQIWLSIAELYSRAGRFTEATKCIEACFTFNILLDLIEYQIACNLERQDLLDESVVHYFRSLSHNPRLVQSLVRLAAVLIKQKRYELAEHNINNALRIDKTSHKAWYHLGLVYEVKGQYERASECFLAAVDFEATAPIEPFSVLPLGSSKRP